MNGLTIDGVAALGSPEYLLCVMILLFGRGMDLLSTWIATPTLVLEANPIARWLGWRAGVVVNVIACGGIAVLPLAAVSVATMSVLVAARNLQSAWLVRVLGEHEYRSWIAARYRETTRGVFLICLILQASLLALVGASLMVFSRQRVPFRCWVRHRNLRGGDRVFHIPWHAPRRAGLGVGGGLNLAERGRSGGWRGQFGEGLAFALLQDGFESGRVHLGFRGKTGRDGVEGGGPALFEGAGDPAGSGVVGRQGEVPIFELAMQLAEVTGGGLGIFLGHQSLVPVGEVFNPNVCAVADIN